MTPDLGETIKGLELVRDICQAKAFISVGEGRTAWNGYAGIQDNAIALLREQERLLRLMAERLSEQETEPKEPRVLTLAEIRALPDGTVLWEERRSDISSGYTTEIFVCEKYGSEIRGTGITTPITDELLQKTKGITLRYWSDKPTAEQRVSAKWER